MEGVEGERVTSPPGTMSVPAKHRSTDIQYGAGQVPQGYQHTRFTANRARLEMSIYAAGPQNVRASMPTNWTILKNILFKLRSQSCRIYSQVHGYQSFGGIKRLPFKFHLYPENGGSRLRRNVSSCLSNYGGTYRKTTVLIFTIAATLHFILYLNICLWETAQ